jgi:hypothetical protein
MQTPAPEMKPANATKEYGLKGIGDINSDVVNKSPLKKSEASLPLALSQHQLHLSQPQPQNFDDANEEEMVMLTKPVGAPAIKSVTGPEAEDVDMPPQ